MGIRFNTDFSMPKANGPQNRVEKQINKLKEEIVEFLDENELVEFEDADFSEDEEGEVSKIHDLSNDNKIRDGVSRFHYKDIDFTIYKSEEEAKSLLVAPKNADLEEFIKEFPKLNETPTNLKSNSAGKAGSVNGTNGINGVLDEPIIQGSTGDCWILSGLMALNTTEKGKAIIKNSLTANEDGSVTVNFKGVGKSYTISQAEIQKHDTDNNLDDEYSNGDNDALVFELAAEKLVADIKSGNVKINANNQDLAYAGEGKGITDGGLPMQTIYYLTGQESTEYYHDDLSNLSKDEISSVLNKTMNNGDTVTNFCLYNGVHTAKTTDGTTVSIDAGKGGHALTITNVTNDTVSFQNPWDTSQTYTMTWDEFQKLGIGYMSTADLSSVNTDMGNNAPSTDGGSGTDVPTDTTPPDNTPPSDYTPPADNTTPTDVPTDVPSIKDLPEEDEEPAIYDYIAEDDMEIDNLESKEAIETEASELEYLDSLLKDFEYELEDNFNLSQFELTKPRKQKKGKHMPKIEKSFGFGKLNRSFKRGNFGYNIDFSNFDFDPKRK